MSPFRVRNWAETQPVCPATVICVQAYRPCGPRPDNLAAPNLRDHGRGRVGPRAHVERPKFTVPGTAGRHRDWPESACPVTPGVQPRHRLTTRVLACGGVQVRKHIGVDRDSRYSKRNRRAGQQGDIAVKVWSWSRPLVKDQRLIDIEAKESSLWRRTCTRPAGCRWHGQRARKARREVTTGTLPPGCRPPVQVQAAWP